MNIQSQIIEFTRAAVTELYAAELPGNQITIQETRKEFAGSFTLVTFPIVRFSKKSPEETGRELGEFLKSKISYIADFNVIKGFLNLVLTPEYWFTRLQNEISEPNYGFFPPNGKRLMVEYSSPNTN